MSKYAQGESTVIKVQNSEFFAAINSDEVKTSEKPKKKSKKKSS